jgi:hypothetical protein
VGDFLPGYGASAWYGAGVPRNTLAEIIDNLNKEINAALADPKMKARLADPCIASRSSIFHGRGNWNSLRSSSSTAPVPQRSRMASS